MFSLKNLVALSAIAFLGVSAAPSSLVENIVVDPVVTSPSAGAVWLVGSTQTVQWETSKIPAEALNDTGSVYVGYVDSGDLNEHLDLAHPLATDFLLTDGAVNVTVPDKPTRNDYIIVLFGDSGNASPLFTITNSTA